MISLFDWIWIEIIAVTTAGAKAKGHKEAASVTDTPTIPMGTRRLALGASGGRS